MYQVKLLARDNGYHATVRRRSVKIKDGTCAHTRYITPENVREGLYTLLLY